MNENENRILMEIDPLGHRYQEMSNMLLHILPRGPQSAADVMTFAVAHCYDAGLSEDDMVKLFDAANVIIQNIIEHNSGTA